MSILSENQSSVNQPISLRAGFTIRPSATGDRMFIVTRDSDGILAAGNPAEASPFTLYDRCCQTWDRTRIFISTIILLGQDPIPATDWQRLAIARAAWEEAEEKRRQAEALEQKRRDKIGRLRSALSAFGIPGDRAEFSDSLSTALVDGVEFEVGCNDRDVWVALAWNCRVCQEAVRFPISGHRNLGEALRRFGYCPLHDPCNAITKEDTSDVD